MHSTLTLRPLTAEDIPAVDSPQFAELLDGYFAQGLALIQSLPTWSRKSTHHGHTVQSFVLPKAGSGEFEAKTRTSLHLNPEEYWVGRASTHKIKDGSGLSAYNVFRNGLLIDHSDQERQYISSCIESERLQVFREREAEVWRMTYKTPPPTSPRTFVFLLLCRETQTEAGKRAFMNISIPFEHVSVPPEQGAEKPRVRGRYVSVEYVSEVDGGARVVWSMATSSCAGGSIPQFLTNMSLPGKITQDVPSFIEYVNGKMQNDGTAKVSAIRL